MACAWRSPSSLGTISARNWHPSGRGTGEAAVLGAEGGGVPCPFPPCCSNGTVGVVGVVGWDIVWVIRASFLSRVALLSARTPVHACASAARSPGREPRPDG